MKLIAPVFLIIGSLSLVQGGAIKCTGLIGFSSIGATSVHTSGLIKFRSNSFDSGHGWSSDIGAFTAQCPGVYHVSLTAYGDAKTRVSLQKRGIAPSAKFEPIISTPLGGGSVTVVLHLKTAEQISMGVTGALQIDTPTTTPITSFNAYKIGD